MESLFGWYRSLFGSNYFISLKKLLDSERKIRSISLLKYSNIDLTSIDKCFDDPKDNENALIDDIENILGEGFIPSEKDKDIIYSVAGYVSRRVLKNNCNFCKDILIGDDIEESDNTEFLENINRGDYVSLQNMFLR